MTGTRRKARIIALQALYEVDSVARDAEAVVSRHLSEVDLSEENGAFVRELVSGILQNKKKIDLNIKKFALIDQNQIDL